MIPETFRTRWGAEHGSSSVSFNTRAEAFSQFTTTRAQESQLHWAVVEVWANGEWFALQLFPVRATS